MTDPSFYLAMATAGLAGLSILTLAGLSGWRGWLALQGEQLNRLGEPAPSGVSANTRIEMADLKERIRKLEAIAAGVDL